jgi:hypothetical protein
MATGRTGPAIFGCEDPLGTLPGEYVVKLRGGMDLREGGLMRELIAAKLAAHFRIRSPEPALVTIDKDLADLVGGVEPSHAAKMRDSVGLNFGTQLLTGVVTWPVDKSIPEPMQQSAVEIFALDALIQNPDRRYDNPNLFAEGDTFLVYDHETAFSFLLELFPSPKPWNLDQQVYLRDHVFYRQLKPQMIDLTRFVAVLNGLSDAMLDGIMADVPSEWKNDNVARIQEHLRRMREHAEEFADQVERMLV